MGKMSIDAAGETAGIVQPKQKRSQRSFGLVRAAVLELLRERRSAQFSLADVSTASGVSIGSIYGRVNGKAELIRLVQSEEFDRLDDISSRRLATAGLGPNFEDAVRDVVREFVAIMWDEADTLAPFFVIGVEDQFVRERGQQSGTVIQAGFDDGVRRAGETHGVVVGIDQIHWAFEISYSVCLRQLSLGMASTTDPDDRLTHEQVARALGDTICAYLTAGPSIE